ncbi:MAG TPA: hypothetical protein VIK33_20305 [Anaerolineae bacterium]
MRFWIRLIPTCAGLFIAFALIALLQIDLAEAATRSVVHTSVSDFNRGTFYRTGLSQQDDGEVTLLTVGIAGQWITTTNATHFVPRSEHAATIANDRIYVFGGRAAANTLTSIQYATINTLTHDLSNWVTATNSLSSLYLGGISALSAATLDGYVYLIGGYSSDEAIGITSTVAFAAIQPDGTLGSFSKTAALPQRLSRSEAIVLNGYLYVIGGRGPDSAGRNTVYYTQPDPLTGAISEWLTATAALPYKVFGHEAFAANDYLYFAGGISNTAAVSGVVPYVYYALPLTGTGDITAGGWISTEVMPFPLYEAAGASFGGQLYSTGGSASAQLTGNPSDYVGAALPLDSGAVVTWVNTSLIYPARFAHAAVVDGTGWIYLIGGTVGSNQPITTSIINAGATTGVGGSAYAQFGRYTSSIIDLRKNYTLQHLQWTADLADTSSVSLTMRYRYRTSSGVWSSWSPSLASINAAGMNTTTYALTQTARYVQYEAAFTSTNGLATPILSRVDVQYDQPDPPQFLKASDPASGGSVQPGTRITYTLRYSNTGESIFHNVVISDRVPISTTYVPGSIFASPGVIADASGNPYLVWQVGTLQPHTGGEAGYVVTIDGDVPEGAQIQNIADLISDEADTQSTAAIHTVGTPPTLIKSAVTSAPGQAGSTVQPGDRITYTLTYSNPSDARALTGVVITDQLPLHLNYVTWFGVVAPDTSLLGSSRTLRWNIGSVPARSGGSVGFVAIVAASAPDSSSIANSAQIDGNEIAPQNSNIRALDVKYRFDLSLSKTDGLLTASAGDRLTYTLRITNTAAYPVTATGVIITDYLEPGLPGLTATVLSFAGGTPGWSFVEVDAGGNQVYAYPIGALGPNQSRAITMAVQITGTLPPGVLAVRNSAEASDDGLSGIEVDPSNQSASDTDVVAGPDLAVTGMRLVSRSGLRVTIAVTVTNEGKDATQGPPATGGWFGSDLYVKSVGDPPPYGPGDRYLGVCPTPTNYCPSDLRPDLYRITKSYGGEGLAPGESTTLMYTYELPAEDVYWLYAQADTFWGQGTSEFGTSANGRIVEGDESNNIYGPLIIDVSDFRVFLPAVLKNR